MLAVRLSKALEERLNNLSTKTHRSKSFYVTKALEKFLGEEEDYAEAIASYEEYLRSGKQGYTLEEMKERYGVE
ncbi:type II toxin-antitoxin system RelB family antitoxin [Candidatus Finniella inopinata]|uniref:Anti-toxin n=1 Tax=Candidatus Finniella inopinata TaxID=1696036 RepID=A0A4Q7DFX8_9PROT|nr:anti-toxin [Candidatus Finniella inopinata]RZI45673.1 anti-toxin [Candidatus Finniella inopinata]